MIIESESPLKSVRLNDDGAILSDNMAFGYHLLNFSGFLIADAAGQCYLSVAYVPADRIGTTQNLTLAGAKSGVSVSFNVPANIYTAPGTPVILTLWGVFVDADTGLQYREVFYQNAPPLWFEEAEKELAKGGVSLAGRPSLRDIVPWI